MTLFRFVFKVTEYFLVFTLRLNVFALAVNFTVAFLMVTFAVVDDTL
jgi:hypothetical protein